MKPKYFGVITRPPRPGPCVSPYRVDGVGVHFSPGRDEEARVIHRESDSKLQLRPTAR